MKLFKFGEIVIFIGIQILQGTYCHIFHNIVWGKACWIFRDFRLEVSFYGKGQLLLAKTHSQYATWGDRAVTSLLDHEQPCSVRKHFWTKFSLEEEWLLRNTFS